MGGDGQSLTNKRKLLESFRVFGKGSEHVRRDVAASTSFDKEERRRRLTHCALSLEPLEAPIVMDLKGNLFSKRAVVDFLLAQKALAEFGGAGKNDHRGDDKGDADGASGSPMGHLKRLRDICELQSSEDSQGAVIIQCPMSGAVASAAVQRFVAFWGCGHTFSESWLARELNSQGKRGPELGQPTGEGEDLTAAVVFPGRKCPVCDLAESDTGTGNSVPVVPSSFAVRLVMDSEHVMEEQLKELLPFHKKYVSEQCAKSKSDRKRSRSS